MAGALTAMVWVREEYAGELAVVLTWLSVLLPWNVTYSPAIPNAGGASALFVRFPFVQVVFVWGVPGIDPVRTNVPVPGWLLPGVFPETFSALTLQAGQGILLGYQVWALGALVVLLALGLSVAYYREEERMEAGPVDPVRALGGLLGLAGVLFVVASYFVATRGFPGIPLPLGAVLMLAFAGVLLTADRT